MKTELEELLAQALARIAGTTFNGEIDRRNIVVERARDAQHGDYASNVALRLARAAGLKPRELAEAIVAALPPSALVASAEVAGAGFINFRLASDAQYDTLRRVLELGERYGCSEAGGGRRVMVEFVSANPTGPLHVGHGRQAAYGATLSNLLAATGHRVQREYYINDAGRQVDILTTSVWVRYLQSCGEAVPFPENGYRADYVNAIAAGVRGAHGEALRHPAGAVLAGLPPDAPAGDKEQYIDALVARMRTLVGPAAYEAVLERSLEAMIADIRADLAEFGVEFDHWTSERALARSGAVERTLARLDSLGQTYEKDGARWLRTTMHGDSEDRVLVRANGSQTYFAPDLAYHIDKRARGFELMIDVWGADHHGYIDRMRAGLVALGEPGESFEVCLMQFVSLYRGTEKIPMGKRDGQFVTLRQLRGEVGNDACRLFYLMRSHDQHLDFDLELAKSRSNDNPVYYLQYAHARVASVMKQLAARGLAYDAAEALANLDRLDGPHEAAVLTALRSYPDVIDMAAANRTPHTLVHHLRELAQAFHTWYNSAQFIVDDGPTRNARLALAQGVQQVLRNGLALLGASAPESM
ncbi:MAG TPA: arginine--tRNA ligase [Steroidobacteraceae bacterium]|nr:arginine--tRNA ligase [Steroidobacteraceae bacterium]